MYEPDQKITAVSLQCQGQERRDASFSPLTAHRAHLSVSFTGVSSVFEVKSSILISEACPTNC